MKELNVNSNEQGHSKLLENIGYMVQDKKALFLEIDRIVALDVKDNIDIRLENVTFGYTDSDI